MVKPLVITLQKQLITVSVIAFSFHFHKGWAGTIAN